MGRGDTAMIDREKVINGLEYHLKELSVGKTCFECPYCGNNPCEIQLITDAIVLLKAQEPVKTEPVRFRIFRAGGSRYTFWGYVCDGCGYKTSEAHTNWRFCPECGRKVKWDGACNC